MSLILDALRKADAERERGAVPGLHAQPVLPLSVEPEPAPQARPVLWIAIGAIVGLASALAVYFAGREPTPAPRASTVEAPAPAPAASAAVTEPTVPRATAAVPAAIPAPWPANDRRATDRAAPPATAHAAALPQSAAPPIPRDQLPDELRAELPPLAVGGSMYSTIPANRTLIVDGRLYREGDRVAAGLTLEEIRLKSAVFGYKGHRFEVRF